MPEFKGERITVSADMHLEHSAGAIWPLLCPVREYAWIEVWQCTLVHTVSGFNELDCVFATDFPLEGGAEVWTTSRFEPFERIEFVRTNALRVIRFSITLTPEGNGTRIQWTQHVTALNDAGNDYVRGKPEAFATQMAILEKMLAHYLESGEMLRGDTVGLIERIGTHGHHRKTG